MKNTIPLLRKKDIKIDGYLSESIWKNDECLGYELIDLKEEQAHPFILKQGDKNWEKVGPYYFIPESLSRNSDLAVVDEVGPLELAGKGVWPALATALFRSQPDFFLVIRETVLEQYLTILKKDRVLVYTVVDKITPAEMTASLRAEIEKRRRTRST
jgi:nucleoside-triphosphatase THEP1